MAQHPVEIIIRPYNAEIDDPYIFSTWTRRAWYSPVTPIHIEKRAWFAQKTLEIKKFLSLDNVRIACVKGAPSMIVGYIVVHGNHIEWMCIKKQYHPHFQEINRLLTNSIKEKIHDRQDQETD